MDKIHILLAEDDENLGILLKEYLQAKGYETKLFTDGNHAFKGFITDHFDLCLLDIMMPVKDGFTLAREIRQLNSDIPIIFLTAKSMKEDVFEGFRIGADDYSPSLSVWKNFCFALRLYSGEQNPASGPTRTSSKSENIFSMPTSRN